MGESSRDTTQLIRLVYGSMCEWSGGKKKMAFFPFESFSLIECVLKVTLKTCLEYVAFFECCDA